MRLTRRLTPSPYRRPLLCLFSALLFTFTAVLAHAQDYTSIVIFGDSLSDVGNVAKLTQAKYGVRIPGPAADYTDGRFTDGDDTVPQRRSTSACGLNNLPPCFHRSPSSWTPSTAEPTMLTASLHRQRNSVFTSGHL